MTRAHRDAAFSGRNSAQELTLPVIWLDSAHVEHERDGIISVAFDELYPLRLLRCRHELPIPAILWGKTEGQ